MAFYTKHKLSLPADMLPEGMGAHIAITPRAGAGLVNDKASSGDTGEGIYPAQRAPIADL